MATYERLYFGYGAPFNKSNFRCHRGSNISAWRSALCAFAAFLRGTPFRGSSSILALAAMDHNEIEEARNRGMFLCPCGCGHFINRTTALSYILMLLREIIDDDLVCVSVVSFARTSDKRSCPLYARNPKYVRTYTGAYERTYVRTYVRSWLRACYMDVGGLSKRSLFCLSCRK